MKLPDFAWWLSDAFSKALKTLSESIGSAIEEKIITVFLSARTQHTTETGLRILWEDAHFKPAIPENLKRVFLQQYSNFLKKAGKSTGIELIDEFFLGRTELVSHIDLRDHPELSELHPFHVVRVYITPTDETTYLEVASFLKIVLPARCSKHFQLLFYYAPLGFGRSPFGRCFGR